MAMNPSTLLPQPSPRAWYIDGPARGRNAPKRERETVRAATPEAANVGKESMVYVCMGMKIPIMPNPNGTRPITGTVHYNLISSIHRNGAMAGTYVNALIGRPTVPEEGYRKPTSKENASRKTHLRFEYA
jgi:hypothetical protein